MNFDLEGVMNERVDAFNVVVRGLKPRPKTTHVESTSVA